MRGRRQEASQRRRDTAGRFPRMENTGLAELRKPVASHPTSRTLISWLSAPLTRNLRQHIDSLPDNVAILQELHALFSPLLCRHTNRRVRVVQRSGGIVDQEWYSPRINPSSEDWHEEPIFYSRFPLIASMLIDRQFDQSATTPGCPLKLPVPRGSPNGFEPRRAWPHQ